MDLQEIFLLRQLKLDDEKAFNTLYDKFWHKLYTHALRKVKSNEIAEEIVHDVFADFWLRRHSIEITASLEAYLFQSVKYAAYKQIKVLKNQNVFINEMIDLEVKNGPVGYQIDNGAELHELLLVSLQNLPKRCRTVFELSRVNQLSHREISQELSITTKTVENQIAKAIKLLKIHLKDFILLFLPFIIGQ